MYKYLLSEKCAVRGCAVTGRNIEFKLYRFPKNPGRYYMWAHFSRNPNLQSKQRRVAYMCGLHFEPRQFRDKLHQILRKGAMPSLRPGQASPRPVSAIPSLTEQAVLENNVTIYQEMDHKIEIKKEPCCLSGALTEVKSETENALGSYNVIKSNTVVCSDMGNKIKIKEEPPVLPQSASWSGVESEDSFLYSEDRITNFKIEIKEEPWWLERSSIDVDNKIKETEEIFVVDSPAKETSRSCTEQTCWVSDDVTRRKTRDLKLENSDYDCKGVCIFKNSVINTSKLFNGTQADEECTVTNNSDYSAVKPNSFSQSCKRSNKCDTNEKTSSSSSRLKPRKLNYQTEKPHKCETCEESFVALSNLKLHKLIHEIKREYTCEICKMSFKHFWQLKKHFTRHTGEDSHKCDFCEKTFACLSHLKDHKLTHDCRRPFKCDICEVTFTRSSNLKRHTLIHEGKGNIKCEICEKSFSRLSHLRRHKLSHHSKTPKKCESL